MQESIHGKPFWTIYLLRALSRLVLLTLSAIYKTRDVMPAVLDVMLSHMADNLRPSQEKAPRAVAPPGPIQHGM